MTFRTFIRVVGFPTPRVYRSVKIWPNVWLMHTHTCIWDIHRGQHTGVCITVTPSISTGGYNQSMCGHH